MTFLLEIPSYPMASFVISIILSIIIACIGCYGLSLFFKRTGNDRYKTLVWTLLQGMILVCIIDYFGHATFALILELFIFILMVSIFIALRESLHMINRTGWSRLWLFVPIVNIAIPYLWAREARKLYPNPEDAKVRLAQEKARKKDL